jgi:protein TonB
MHTLHNDWDHSRPHRDPVSRIAAGIATLLLYLPLFFLVLTHPTLLVTPAAVAPRTAETIMRLLPRPQVVPPRPDFITRLIRPQAVNAPAPHIVSAPSIAPPALLPVTAAEISLLAGGAPPGAGARSGTGTGGNGAAPAACIDPAYLAAITRHVAHYFRYPAEAVRTRTTGITYVRFVIDKGGHPSALSVEIGSGEPLLDNYALALMREAAPLPPIPDRMHIDQLNAVLPIVFMIQGKAPPRTHPGGQMVTCN